MADTFRALEVSESDGKYSLAVVDKTLDQLPAGEVLIRVHYSSLNYKDALSASGNRGVTRTFPHTPGIDAAGIVVESAAHEWKPGDQVLVTGFDLGMNTRGGFAQYVRVPASWVVMLPAGLSLRESMIFGTAGFTAGLSVDAILRHGVTPGQGRIAVSGATGGVGSMSVAILAKLRYQVSAITGKDGDLLTRLGASETITRTEMEDTSGKALLKPRFAAAVDTVGGNVLATILKSLQYGGIATACGMVGGGTLPVTVFPFILKGVHLAGIDSVEAPMPKRLSVWEALAGPWKPEMLGTMAEEITLAELPAAIEKILHGKMTGRVIIRLPD
ncbi:YhdH/YhfP family quinone oxidoreductase [Dyadobacter sandarakinus]|uniref:YhdH/YhfP family quinone oxidoreductase n=1 Tax=Dyadobacter sandarakinus TaxID=2747268 RepID=A0ABX7I3D8_9BACT|nr:YhdH/YhfP family quinone oxidoreductase [Dyadobacter sandarakinus]QRR00564.1 YhdH/YhfP family quinone oxidoreductase [Dyadobacter sandarakinus]